MLLPGGHWPEDDPEDRDLFGERYPGGEEQVSLSLIALNQTPIGRSIVPPFYALSV